MEALVGDLVTSLGPELLRAVHVPPERRVGDVVLFDAGDPHCVRPEAIVLGVGAGDALGLVQRAARAGAAGVVLRAGGVLPARLVEEAAAHEVALLTIAPQTAWGQLYSFLRTALASAGMTGRTEVAGVPVGDLFALADAIATAVGGAVTIEDPQWRVLAYSNLGHPIDDARRDTILGRMPPVPWQRRIEETGVGRTLRFGTGVARLEGGGLSPRLAAAVRAGDELLGSIWVAQGRDELGPVAERELARIAERAAVHLLSHRASDDIKRRLRGTFVRELLEGRAGRETARVRGPFTVIVLQPDGGYAARPERILSIVSLYSENVHPEAMCALVDDRFWAVVPLPRGREQERGVELAEKIVRGVEGVMPVRLNAGIGVPVETVADVPRSRRAAEQALRVLEQRGGARVVHIGQVRAHAVLLDLLDLAAAAPGGLREGKLADLLARDPAHAEQHRDSLRAYLDCSCNVAQAATRLGVHPNTLRYRVRRALELSGLDLDNPDERLLTELQLRMNPI
jgi:hypothetical protein